MGLKRSRWPICPINGTDVGVGITKCRLRALMTTTRRIHPSTLVALVGLGLLAGCNDGESGQGTSLRSSLGYDEGTSELLVVLNRDLADGEVLHTRVRSLAEGDSLDCLTEAASIPKFSR